jgi:hypothetical protein
MEEIDAKRELSKPNDFFLFWIKLRVVPPFEEYNARISANLKIKKTEGDLMK